MDKRSPHCPLVLVKTLLGEGKVRTTFSALAGGAAMGLDFTAMLRVVHGLTMADFYKSMTTHADHRIWQDVYRTACQTERGTVQIYLKLTVIDDVLIVSFKES